MDKRHYAHTMLSRKFQIHRYRDRVNDPVLQAQYKYDRLIDSVGIQRIIFTGGVIRDSNSALFIKIWFIDKKLSTKIEFLSLKFVHVKICLLDFDMV